MFYMICLDMCSIESKGDEKCFIWVCNRFLILHVYNITINCSLNDFELFPVCDMSFKFVWIEESTL